MLQHLFKKLDSKVHLVYVNTPNANFKSTQEMEKEVAEFLKKADGNLDKLADVNYVSDYTVEKRDFKFR